MPLLLLALAPRGVLIRREAKKKIGVRVRSTYNVRRKRHGDKDGLTRAESFPSGVPLGLAEGEGEGWAPD